MYKITSTRQNVQTMISVVQNEKQIKISSEDSCRSRSSKKDKNYKTKKEAPQAEEQVQLEKT